MKQMTTSLWEKLMYMAGGSVIGAIVALLVVWYLIVRWWTKR